MQETAFKIWSVGVHWDVVLFAVCVSLYFGIGFCSTIAAFVYQKYTKGKVDDESEWLLIVLWPLMLIFIPHLLMRSVIWLVNCLPIGPRPGDENWPNFPNPRKK